MHGISPHSGSSQSVFNSLPGIIGRFGESHAFPANDTPSWKKLDVYRAFSESLARDTKSGVVTAGGKELLDALVSPDTLKPRVTVYNFNVGPHQARDTFIVKREPIEPGKVNFVLWMPEKDFKSNYEFKSYQEMDDFLKKLPGKAEAFNAFLGHFGNKTESAPVRTSMLDRARAPEGSAPKALMGPGKQITENVFEHLDKRSENPTTIVHVNGLVNQQLESIEAGTPTYSGIRPDGEKVIYRYDNHGHLLGSGDKGNFYFLVNGENNHLPLVPMTLKQFRSIVFDDFRHVMALAHFLEYPFSGVSTLLQSLGVSKVTADRLERGLDNPVNGVLLFLNEHNDIGRVFGLPKSEMDAALTYFASTAQGFVPVYGPYRTIAAVIGKAIRQEPVTEQEARDAANGLGIKLDLKSIVV